MAAFLYPVLLWLALPFVQVRLWWRARREPAYGQRREERFGLVPANVRKGPIWFHTVSAGESIAAAPVIQELIDEFPQQPFLVTTMTPTGSQQVSERLGSVADHCYAPYDFGFAVQRFFAGVEPKLLVLMETELWPNLIAHARRNEVPVILINGRLSARSAAGYAKVSSLTKPMLESLRFLACQSEDHVTRFVRLGACAETTQALGSVKFDVQLPAEVQQITDELRARFLLSDALVWIAASTHPGEEAIVLDAFAQVRRHYPELKLILVPRHPARTDEVLQLLSKTPFRVCRQSEDGGESAADVILGDVMGSLLALYGLADVAFVGGSLVPVGGHNPIEPALHRLPVVVGPHRFNFAEAMSALSECGALFDADQETLASCIVGLLDDPQLRASAGQSGLDCVRQHRGATRRLRELLRGEIAAAIAQ